MTRAATCTPNGLDKCPTYRVDTGIDQDKGLRAAGQALSSMSTTLQLHVPSRSFIPSIQDSRFVNVGSLATVPGAMQTNVFVNGTEFTSWVHHHTYINNLCKTFSLHDPRAYSVLLFKLKMGVRKNTEHTQNQNT